MKIENINYKTIWFNKKNKFVEIINQNKLPFEFKIERLSTFEDLVTSINNMKVRGAPLIGAAAAFGLYLSFKNTPNIKNLRSDALKLILTRPTAVNLSWAVNKIMKKVESNLNQLSQDFLLNEAQLICREDIESCKKIGQNGLKLIEKIYSKKNNNTVNILTHCNAGWLATIDWGTATAPIYTANQKGIDIHVWVDETRPRNQGSSLTSFACV